MLNSVVPLLTPLVVLNRQPQVQRQVTLLSLGWTVPIGSSRQFGTQRPVTRIKRAKLRATLNAMAQSTDCLVGILLSSFQINLNLTFRSPSRLCVVTTSFLPLRDG